MKNNKNLDLVQRQLEAYNSKKIDEFCACFHPEVSTHRLHTGGIEKGLESFYAGYKELFAKNPKLHCEVLKRTVLVHTIIDHEYITGLENGTPPFEALAIYAFKDDLIDRVWFAR